MKKLLTLDAWWSETSLNKNLDDEKDHVVLNTYDDENGPSKSLAVQSGMSL